MVATAGSETEARGLARHRRGLSWLAVLAVVAAVVLPMVGAWNPWNLVLVDRVLFHPILAGLVVAAALCLLAHLYLRDWLLRLVVFAGLGGVTGLWMFVWLLAGSFLLPTWPPPATVASPFDDTEAAVSGDEMGSAAFVWLRADRGLLSRENEVGVVGSSGSGAPPVDVRFTAPGRLVVTYQGEVVSRVRFDPHDLEVIDTECHTLTSPRGPTVTSCIDDAAS
jgi:hypothetical protein